MKIVQLKPSRAEELAEIFERYASEARAGDITGYSAMLIRPGGKYTRVGWQGEDANRFQEIGILFMMMMAVWQESQPNT